jgi:hypothetical protein
MAYRTAEYALAEADLASRLVFFLCGLETMFNLLINPAFDPTAYQPSDGLKPPEPTDNWYEHESQFELPLDPVWEAVGKQIRFRLKTGSWYQLPFPPDQQFACMYRLMVETTEKTASSRLPAGDKHTGSGIKTGTDAEAGKNPPGMKSRGAGNTSPAKKAVRVVQETRKGSAPGGKNTRAGRSSKQEDRGVKSRKSRAPGTQDDPIHPPLPNKTIRPSSGTTGFQSLTDANGDPLPELYEFVQSTAAHIVKALPSPSQWSNAVMYLLECLEAGSDPHRPLDSSLDNICRLITRRLNRGNWT